MTFGIMAAMLIVGATSVFGFLRHRKTHPGARLSGNGWALAHHIVFLMMMASVITLLLLPDSFFANVVRGAALRSRAVISGTGITFLLIPLSMIIEGAVTFVKTQWVRWITITGVWGVSACLLLTYIQVWLR